MMEPEKVQEELDRLWNKYQEILEDSNSNWEKANEARAILYLTGQVYCEEIALEAIERRLHLLKEKIELIAMLSKEANKQGVYLPIFCVSSNNNRESALERGANEFMWKKEFWFGKGKQKLEEYLKAKI